MFGSEKYNADEIGRLWKRLIPLENARDAQAAIIQSQKEEIELLKEKIQQPSENQKIAQQAGPDRSLLIKGNFS